MKKSKMKNNRHKKYRTKKQSIVIKNRSQKKSGGKPKHNINHTPQIESITNALRKATHYSVTLNGKPYNVPMNNSVIRTNGTTYISREGFKVPIADASQTPIHPDYSNLGSNHRTQYEAPGALENRNYASLKKVLPGRR